MVASHHWHHAKDDRISECQKSLSEIVLLVSSFFFQHNFLIASKSQLIAQPALSRPSVTAHRPGCKYSITFKVKNIYILMKFMLINTQLSRVQIT